MNSRAKFISMPTSDDAESWEKQETLEAFDGSSRIQYGNTLAMVREASCGWVLRLLLSLPALFTSTTLTSKQ